MQASLNSVLGVTQLQDGSEAKTWNVDVAIEVLKGFVPDMQSHRIIEALDHEGFHVPDQEALYLLTKAWKKLSLEHFPLQALLCLSGSTFIKALLHLLQEVAAYADLKKDQRLQKKCRIIYTA